MVMDNGLKINESCHRHFTGYYFNLLFDIPALICDYSTVTLLARLRGLSTSSSFATPM